MGGKGFRKPSHTSSVAVLSWPGGFPGVKPSSLASPFSHLLQLHLFGGFCLGMGLGPPLCRSSPTARIWSRSPQGLRDHILRHSSPTGSVPGRIVPCLLSPGITQPWAPSTLLLQAPIYSRGPFALCLQPPTSGSQSPGDFRHTERASTFLARKRSGNDSSLCLVMEGKPRCSCLQRADLRCAASSARHFPLCWSKRLFHCGFAGLCLSYRLENVLLATLALNQPHAAGSGWPRRFRSAKLSLQQL